MNFDCKIQYKNEFKNNNEKYPEKSNNPKTGFLTMSISKLFGRAIAMPTAWELIHFDLFSPTAIFAKLLFNSSK